MKPGRKTESKREPERKREETMRIRVARRISQAFFVLLFFFLVWMTSQHGVRVSPEGETLGYPVSGFIEISPLSMIGTALATRSIYSGMLLALVVLVPTFFIGRFFCGWVCPFGACHHLIGWLGWRGRKTKDRLQANQYRSIYRIKYLILAAFLAASLFGSLQIGLLDPLALFHRSVTIAVLPAANLMGIPVSVRQPEFGMAWIVGLILLTLFLLNLVIPRFFCRMLCPLGALLGFFSRFAPWRIHTEQGQCRHCGLCHGHCEGACNPEGPLRMSECLVCFNCLDDCPDGGIGFRFLPPIEGAKPGPEVPTRRVALATLVGACFFPFARLSGKVRKSFHPALVRPPGSLEENLFLQRCIKCGQCMKVCPTNVLQPAAFEGGAEALWTPILNPTMGHCLVDCVLCSHVCPTGAILPLHPDQRTGRGTFRGEPVKIGTAFVDRGRCLPWAMNRTCLVCEEVCPVSPKAIHALSDGTTPFDRPIVDPALCIGCGKCMYNCPVKDLPAIRVTAIGESRSEERSLMMPRQ